MDINQHRASICVLGSVKDVGIRAASCESRFPRGPIIASEESKDQDQACQKGPYFDNGVNSLEAMAKPHVVMQLLIEMSGKGSLDFRHRESVSDSSMLVVSQLLRGTAPDKANQSDTRIHHSVCYQSIHWCQFIDECRHYFPFSFRK